MMETSSGKIFISHAGQDKHFVDRLVSDLSAQGIPVWYDKLDVRLGDSIPGKINSGIAEAKYFLIVLSPAAIKSKWVQEELNTALMRQIASAGTFLIPTHWLFYCHSRLWFTACNRSSYFEPFSR